MEDGEEAEAGACAEEREVAQGSSPLSSSFSASLSSSQDWKRLMKPPNKKKYEEEMEEATKAIRAKEAEMKSLGVSSPDGLAAELRGIKGEREAAIGKRKKIDSDLKLLSQDITKKTGLLSRTESNLLYKTEAKFDATISKMECQLKTQNFRLAEERRIVAEVDKMKRSKKFLVEYFAQKKDVDKLRESQRRMRGEREYYYKAVTNLKNREDDLKRVSQEKKERNEEIKKDLDQLYERKRQLFAEFKQQETEYQRMKVEKRHQQRKETFKKKEETRKAKEQAWRKDMQEYASQVEPYNDEKKLCNTLISYLHRYISTDQDDGILPSPRDEAPEHPIGAAGPSVADSLDDGMFVLLKKSEDKEPDYSISTKRQGGRRSRKGRKLSVTKPLAHTPQIISQFSSLRLSAPSNISEVTASIEQLQARKLYYDEEISRMPPHPLLGNLSGSFSSSGSLSSLESPMRERSSTWGFVEVPPPIAENQTPSDAGASAESGFHDMSRQASKTESSESAVDSSTCDQALEEMIQQSAEYGESVHSRSSSDTITPEDHFVDDLDHKEQNQSTCSGDSAVDQSNVIDASAEACNDSQGSEQVLENQSAWQSLDKDSFDSLVFENTKSADSSSGEPFRGGNFTQKTDYEFGMKKKIANYDTDFPPALSRQANVDRIDSCDEIKLCDVKICDESGNSETVDNICGTNDSNHDNSNVGDTSVQPGSNICALTVNPRFAACDVEISFTDTNAGGDLMQNNDSGVVTVAKIDCNVTIREPKSGADCERSDELMFNCEPESVIDERVNDNTHGLAQNCEKEEFPSLVSDEDSVTHL